jgi:hypothetical protein
VVASVMENRETSVHFGNAHPFATRKNGAHVWPKLRVSSVGQIFHVAMKNENTPKGPT